MNLTELARVLAAIGIAPEVLALGGHRDLIRGVSKGPLMARGRCIGMNGAPRTASSS